MSQATSAFTVIKTFAASEAISAGHFVEMDGANSVCETDGANTFVGVYIGTSDCASGDHIEVAILGPCRVWCDATAAITRECAITPDASGHGTVTTTDGDKIAGFALEALASGTGYVEVLLVPGFYAAAAG